MARCRRISGPCIGDAIGLRWTARRNLSLHPTGTDVIEEHMTLHLPIILFQQGDFGVGVSETVRL